MTKLLKLLKLLALLFAATAMPTLGANHSVGIGDGDCPWACFWPATLTINPGDAVTFSIYAETVPTGPHNVVADDGSFRCARGCDGEGGDGTPADYMTQWSFTRSFAIPGRFGYHDEVTGVSGVIIVRESATFAIGPGVTGAWFDPAQSGHGLFIEVLPANRFLAAWFTFDPDGAPTWFLGVGTYSGNTATITEVRETTGGRWIPNFDASRIVNNAWGKLTFTFTGCNHGKVDFESVAGYGTGSMNLTRLTQPLGMACPRVDEAPAAKSWAFTGDLNIARSGHTETLLANGNVLVVGGDGSGASAELYDSVTGQWRLTGSLATPRRGHTATLLPSGKVLVTGGGGYFTELTTAELYDPVAGVWSPTGSMTSARYLHTATPLQSGMVLVVGGFGKDYLASAELYDPATGNWSPAGKLSGPRSGHSATLLKNGQVLVAGGSDDIDFLHLLRHAELYDPALGTWRTTGRMTMPRMSHAATLLQNGNVLVMGGDGFETPDGGWHITLSSAEVFDPHTGTWSATGNLADGQLGLTATALANGIILVAGGYRARSPQWFAAQFATASALYDLEGGSWSKVGELHLARAHHTATLLPNGKVLVAGGTTSYPGGGVNSAELYSPAALSAATIGPGITGAWYDPAQNGHGLFVEVLNDNRFLAWWFTFNPAGTQRAAFGGVGTYSGNTAIITEVYQTTGGRWIPNFDPGQIVNNPWGTLTFTFTDCNHGKVEFNSTRGFGTGSMSLTRLTLPAGLTCP